MAWTIPDKGEGDNDIQSIAFQEHFDVLVAGLAGTDCVLEGCAVTGGADMTPAVAAGTIISNGVRYIVAGADVTIGTANATNPRLDLIVVTSSGALAVRAGTAAAAPKPPARTANDVALAMVFVPANDTTIGSGAITDMRAMRPDLLLAFRPPDIMVRPGVFGGLTFIGPGNVFDNAELGQDGGASGSVLSQTFRARFFGNSLTADDSNSATWAWNDLGDDGLAWRGDAAGLGGFRVEMLFNPAGLMFNTNPVQGFFGLCDVIPAVGEDIDTARTNCFGVGFTAAAANSLGSVEMHLIHNDSSGAPTVTGLGSNFPVQNKLYMLELWADPNASAISYRLRNLSDGFVASGSVSSDIPGATVFMAMHGVHAKDGADDGIFQWDMVMSNVWLGSPLGVAGISGV
jgi:hypothetical protein